MVTRFRVWLASVLSVLAQLAPDARDLLGLGGLTALAYGCGLVYPPAGFIVPGVVLLYVALWHTRIPAPPAERS
jgi:hypothetical protein